ncbi:c-type cytochrome [Roseivivax sp. CAU 1761]
MTRTGAAAAAARGRRPALWALALAAAPGLTAGPTLASEAVTLAGHGGPVMAIAVAPDGAVASASFDNSVGLWSDDGTPRWLDGHEAAVNSVTFAPDGSLVSGADDFDVIHWSPDGAPAERLEGHAGKVAAVAADLAGIASASWDGTIGLWPAGGGAPRFLDAHDGAVNDVVLSDDGARLYSASADGTLRVWDRASGTETARLVEHGFGLNVLALDEAAGWLAYGAVDGVTRIVDLDGAPLADLSLERRPILALAVSPAGDRLAVGDGEGYIMVVTTADWSVERDFRAALSGPIWALAFSPDGATLYAAGLDAAVHGWPVGTLDAQAPMPTGGESFLADPATMSNGERQFMRKCSICHTLTPGSARRAGPTLHALFGRKAGTVPDYIYSEALAQSDLVWDEESVAALFEIGPLHYVPGTKMPMQRITSAQDRADLVAYLRRATAAKETLE